MRLDRRRKNECEMHLSKNTVSGDFHRYSLVLHWERECPHKLAPLDMLISPSITAVEINCSKRPLLSVPQDVYKRQEQYREVIDKKLESNLVKKAHHDSMVMELQKWAQGWDCLLYTSRCV